MIPAFMVGFESRSELMRVFSLEVFKIMRPLELIQQEECQIRVDSFYKKGKFMLTLI